MNIQSEQKKPKHVAIIMDGNGRWAQRRGQERLFGHSHGKDSVRKITELAVERDIKVLTLYAFSTENWARPESEVSGLFLILNAFLKQELETLMKNDVRLNMIGDIDGLPSESSKLLKKVINETANNSRMDLVLALNYSGRADMVSAVKQVMTEVKLGKLSEEDIDESIISSKLSTHPFGDPDLIIRTSGEQRLSNFLLWEAAYSEFYFTKVLWPDFDEKDFDLALDSFGRRDRRFGLAKPNQVEANKSLRCEN